MALNDRLIYIFDESGQKSPIFLVKVPTKKIIFVEKLKESSIGMESGTKLEISSLK